MKRPPLIVPGPPVVPAAPVSGSAVRSMAGSIAAARLRTVKTVLEDEASMFKTMDILQTALFASAMAFLSRDMEGLAVSVLAIGTFLPMLIRRWTAKWRNSLMP